MKLFIVDSFALVRDLLTRCLEDAFPNAEVVAWANEPGVFAEVSQGRPDVLVLGIDSIHKDQIEAAQRLKTDSDGLKLVMLSMQSDASTVCRALRADADAYVLRNDEISSLVDAVHAVLNNKSYLSPQLRGLIEINSGDDEKAQAVGFESLTERQVQILALFATGLSTREIASKLKLKSKTLDRHRRQIQWSLGVDSIAELTRVAVYHGLVTLDGQVVDRETTPSSADSACGEEAESEARQP